MTRQDPPTTPKQTFNTFVAATQEPVGVFQAASVWKGSYEVFRYEMHDGELRAVYPQTGDKDRMRVRARRCNEAGMDYCLEVTGASRGVKRYYSREGWEIGAATRPEQLLDRVASIVRAAN